LLLDPSAGCKLDVLAIDARRYTITFDGLVAEDDLLIDTSLLGDGDDDVLLLHTLLLILSLKTSRLLLLVVCVGLSMLSAHSHSYDVEFLVA
jgi:hypothetical protein